VTTLGRRAALGAALSILLLLGNAAVSEEAPPTPVVVNISTTKAEPPASNKAAVGSALSPNAPLDEFFREFFDKEGNPNSPNPSAPHVASLGSGFIIDPSGLIVTNNHVIDNAEAIWVTLSDNKTLQAKIVGRDPISDLALLKIDAKAPLPVAAWGDSTKARVGEWVLAIGNPFGLGGTVTSGIISATARDIHFGTHIDFLQTDAPINRGNSGGPMFNMDGQVIGINTAIYSPSGGSIGIGFAIPSALAKEVVGELKNEADHTVHRGWLGVRIQAVTDEIAESLGLDKARGALVASVSDKGPAEAAGIQPGDVILDFDGKEVSDMRRLPRLVAETAVDKTVAVTLWRKRAETTIQVKVGRLEDSDQRLASAKGTPNKTRKSEGSLVKTLGLTLSGITPELKDKYSLGDDAKGVVVVDVAKDTAAADKGFHPGDVIMEAAQEEVTTPQDLAAKIDEAKKVGRKSILLLVQHEGDLRFVALRVDQG
jgi:serine protease Do